MYNLFNSDIHGKHHARSFVDLEAAKAILFFKPFSIIIMDEDTDYPGVFDLMDSNGTTYTLEPEGFVEPKF